MKEKQKWIVRMKCTVIKDVYLDECTEEEARTRPFEHACEEHEIDMQDWEVKSVEPS